MLRASLGKDPRTGKYRSVSRTFHGSARAANDALRDLIDEQVPLPDDGRRVTFSQLLNRWLEECERLDLSPTTLRNYRSQIELRVRPELGTLEVTAVAAKHLDDMYGRMKDDGLSPKSIRNCHGLISSALHQAVRWGWVRETVAERAKPPRLSQNRVRAPSVEVVRSIIETAEHRDSRLAPLLMLGALTGLRRGELCALRWSDMRLDIGELTVARSVVVVHGGLQEKSTETDRERRIALDDVALLLLTQHRARIEDWAKQADVSLIDDAFVFWPYVDASRPFRPDNVTGFFMRVRDELGLANVRVGLLHDPGRFRLAIEGTVSLESQG